MMLKSLSAITFYESASSIICSYFDRFLKVTAIGFWTNLCTRKAVDGTLQWYWSDCLCHCPWLLPGTQCLEWETNINKWHSSAGRGLAQLFYLKMIFMRGAHLQGIHVKWGPSFHKQLWKRILLWFHIKIESSTYESKCTILSKITPFQLYFQPALILKMSKEWIKWLLLGWCF